MKTKYITFRLLILSVVLGLFSCESIDLDQAENPNLLRPDQSNPDLFLNSIQVDFANFVELMSWNGSNLVRINNLAGRNYQNIGSLAPASLDFEWEIAYQANNRATVNGILADIRAMAPAAEASDLFYHTGMGQFIEAYTIVTLVDFFGDVPYSEAIQAEGATPILSPAVDSGASIYEAALVLLDEAIANFGRTPPQEPANDFYYGGNWNNWVKACNTLKMKIYLQRRLVDANAIASFEAIEATGDYITTTAEDLQFTWGSQEVQPDTRHPRYANNYQSVGGQVFYTSNWLVNYMLVNDDPRLRYYFYRQVNAVPGEEVPPNEETIACSLEPTPQHYTDGGFTFCTLPNGYWGRDHGQNAGIPPDGFLRTVFGVYPAGGKFDDNSFSGIGLGAGGGGAGITPMFEASYVDFMKAELAMLAGDINTAKTEMLNGTEKSIRKVRAFGPAVDTGADFSLATTDGQITNYLTNVDAAFEAADATGKWDVISEQYWVALYGNGIDAYNYYRRTGFPTTLQPNLEPEPGNFVRSLFYPAIAANNNASITQKADQNVQVFWDTNPASPAFPIAN